MKPLNVPVQHKGWQRQLLCSAIITQSIFFKILTKYGQAMGCILSVQTLIYALSQSLQRCIPYHVIFHCVIMALDCVSCMPWLHPRSMHWHSRAWLTIISSHIISNNNCTPSSSKLEASRMVWANHALLFWTMLTTLSLYDSLEMW